ncbi:MAG: hemerythrin domain-containing protein [Thermodesulfobacteriota bacterium]
MAEHPFLKHLGGDHEEQKKLGKQLIDASSSEEREKMRQKFYEELYPHMVGEEASMFKRLKDADDEEIRGDALENLQEHHVAKLVLRELMDLETDSEVFKAKAKVLDELNRHHIEEEEKEAFEHLQKLCSDQELSELFEQYEQTEEKAKEE